MIIWIALAWSVVIVTGLSAPVLRRAGHWIRLAGSLVFIGLLTAAMVPLVGAPYDPRIAPALPSVAIVAVKALVAGWWLLLARIFIHAGSIALGINHQQHAARLLADLAAGAIYISALLAIIDLVFGVSVTGLVATSGIIAIVLGLALQSTLSDLFSGIAIGIDRPFGVGDLVAIEGVAEGRVIETNWRSTRIATGANDVATVPNSVVAKARITNRSAPSETQNATVTVMLDPAVPPRQAIAMLRSSILTTAQISPGTIASVACTDLRGDGAVYDVKFPVRIIETREATSELLDQIARHARYNGIALAPRNGAPVQPVVVPGPHQLLEEILITVALGRDERETLADRLVLHEGDAGRTLFTQGGSLASLFVVGRGAFEVTRDLGNGPHRLGTIGPGDYIGELALLTGSPNAATVTALTPFLAYEVTKEMIAPVLRSNPEVLHVLERAALKSQTLIDRMVASQVCPVPPFSVGLIDRIHAFFEMRNTHPVG